MPNVDLSDLSHSYPFLHLSRKYGVDYKYILKLVEHYDKGTLNPPHDLMEPFYAVYRVCKASWRWDMSRAGEKGL